MQKSVYSGKSYEYEQSFCVSPDDVGRFLMYQMGEINCEPGYICAPHRQWCYEITYVIDGEGINTVDGEDGKMTKGDLFLTPLDSIHKIEAVTRLRYMFIGFDVKDDKSTDCTELRRFYDSAPTVHIRGGNDIMHLFNKCFEEYYSAQPAVKLMKECLIAELVTRVMRLFIAEENQRKPFEEKAKNTGISIYAVRQYIDTNIGKINSISDAAKTLGYSPTYLSHKFKDEMRITLREYIAERRIEEGIRLVSELGMTVNEAAANVGFSTPQSFCKAFKKIKGYSPKYYCSSVK
ncbi:MAG: helix-turn-helix transcriptional regulator [Clostridia bacterium]|nr:helix-turn-helix transcriptional regulator [Clostridia bacterium]